MQLNMVPHDLSCADASRILYDYFHNNKFVEPVTLIYGKQSTESLLSSLRSNYTRYCKDNGIAWEERYGLRSGDSFSWSEPVKGGGAMTLRAIILTRYRSPSRILKKNVKATKL